MINPDNVSLAPTALLGRGETRDCAEVGSGGAEPLRREGTDLEIGHYTSGEDQGFWRWESNQFRV